MSHQKSTTKGLTHLVKAGLIAICILLTGCATPYRPEHLTGGYSDFRLEDTTYRVRFKGNNCPSRDKIEQFLLYRGMELTTQPSYDHFLV